MNETDWAEFLLDTEEILISKNPDREKFERETLINGKITKHELAAGGSSIPVTPENYSIWVSRLLSFYLVGQNYRNQLLLDRFKEAFQKYTNFENLKKCIEGSSLKTLLAGCGQNIVMARMIESRLTFTGFRISHNSNLFKKELFKLNNQGLRGFLWEFFGTYSMTVFNEEWEILVRFVGGKEGAGAGGVEFWPTGCGCDWEDCEGGEEMRRMFVAVFVPVGVI